MVVRLHVGEGPGMSGNSNGQHCTYAGCSYPTETPQFYRIAAKNTAGGQDWSSLEGSVLCSACYQRFKQRGTLERSDWCRLIALKDRRCSNPACESPTDSRAFYRIDAGKRAGGQDWSALVGSVLCHQCYDRFRLRGTLEKSRAYKKPLAAAERRCKYAGCERPSESRQFYQIDAGKTTGGRDWSGLAGSVLCDSCYKRFLNRGTLERTGNSKAALAGCDRRCMYDRCAFPTKSRNFTLVEGDSRAGGQDWSSVAGCVLCDACYNRFWRRGTLERSDRRALDPPGRAREASDDAAVGKRMRVTAQQQVIDKGADDGGVGSSSWGAGAGRASKRGKQDQGEHKERGV